MVEGTVQPNEKPANGGTGGQLNPHGDDEASDNGGTPGGSASSQPEQRPSASS